MKKVITIVSGILCILITGMSASYAQTADFTPVDMQLGQIKADYNKYLWDSTKTKDQIDSLIGMSTKPIAEGIAQAYMSAKTAYFLDGWLKGKDENLKYKFSTKKCDEIIRPIVNTVFYKETKKSIVSKTTMPNGTPVIDGSKAVPLINAKLMEVIMAPPTKKK